MSYYTVEVNRIDVVGGIWLPYGATAAMSYNLSKYDLENIGEVTRENVERWVNTHCGDFSSIKDFRADLGPVLLDWQDQENEIAFNDCMFPVDA